MKQKLENLGLNEKNDMVEYSIEDFFDGCKELKKSLKILKIMVIDVWVKDLMENGNITNSKRK